MEVAPTAERALEEHATVQLRAVADRTSSPLLVVSSSGRIRYANPAVSRLLGRAPASLVGHDLVSLVHPADASVLLAGLYGAVTGPGLGRPFEYRVHTAEGEWRVLSCVASSLMGIPGAAGVLLSATDITEQRQHEQALRDLALRDPLTGLANRTLLVAHLGAAMAAGGRLQVVFVDVDHFRRINESIGHTVGDGVLRALAGRIASLVPPGGLAARFGGDTFVLVLNDLDEETALSVVYELLAGIADPLFVAGHELRVTASAGIVTGGRERTPECLLRDADAALTQAKRSQRGGVVAFSEQIRANCLDRLAVESDLRHAAARHELHLYFQPIISLSGDRPSWNEALLRWARNGGEIITPGAFLDVAEESGLIVPIGEWVIAEVVLEVQRDPSLRASLNLSARQLALPGLADQVERLVQVSQVAAHQLAFEVTETALMENFETATGTLDRLRRLGCLVGLDDFGVGYSSLNYLHRLPVDFIKLDRSLVDAIDSDPQAKTIAASFISLAKALSLETVAEGIERPSLIGPLTAMGCDYGQGWHFGHAQPRIPLSGPTSPAKEGRGRCPAMDGRRAAPHQKRGTL
jgi:diguanylate cyclase (GGDEF)-like protein/PAS domain S-box-containing protein